MPESVNDRRFPSNPTDVDADRSAGDADARHRFVARAVVGSGPLASLFPESVHPVVRDWTLSALLVVESGLPYSAYVTTDINGDRNRFNDIAPGTTRNQFRMPAWSSLDLRLTKDIGGRGSGRRRAIAISFEAFNLLNRANYTHVNNTRYAVDGTTLRLNPLFGQLTDQGDPRIVQLGARISF